MKALRQRMVEQARWLRLVPRAGLAWIPLGALLATLLLAASPWGPRLDAMTEDTLLLHLAPAVPLDPVLVLDIDERSLQRLKPELGSWPYRRDAYALVIDYLREAGARLVAIDIVFADARDGDDALRRSLQAPGAPVVLAAAAWPRPVETDGMAQPDTAVDRLADAGPAGAPAMHWPAWLLPAGSLQARVAGLVTLPMDDDGRLRRLAVLHESAGRRLPALPIAAALASHGDAALSFDAGARAFRGGPWRWPVDAAGRIVLPPPAPAEAIPRLPFHAVAAAALGLPAEPGLRERLAGRAVFIGSSAGLANRVMTPVGQRAGTDWLASAYAALAQPRQLQPAPPWMLVPMLLIALAPALCIAWRGRPVPWRDAAAAAVAALLLVGGAALLLRLADLLLPLALPLAALVGATLLGLVAQQRQLRADNRRLQYERAVAVAANAAKSEFLASMSHELRTPLNGVIGASQLMRDEGDDPQRREELLDIIRSSGSHLMGLIDGVLNLARIEAGALELSHEAFNLVDGIEAVLATAAVPARGKGLQMAAVLDPRLPAWRLGDPMRLRQVLLNLVGNAVKFTLRGEVVLRVEQGADADELVFRIIDTGIGLDAEARARIFEPFRQADSSTTRRFGGSGLGLTISRRLVQAMAGTITVDSEPGRGSCFTVRLPLPAAPEQPATAALQARVAFIEPHPASAQALAGLLQRMGCEALPCEHPQDVRAALAQPDALGRPPWLLVATDNDAALDLLEASAEWVDPERVIGMTLLPWYAAESARERVRLPRSVLKPVLRSALVSRIGANSRLDAAVAGSDGGSAAPTPGRRGGWVLIVEDDPVNQAIVGAMLANAGFQTQVAPDGRSALKLFAEQWFDLLLMDWQMPDMDGVEVTRRLRAGDAGPRGRTVPVVALTANAFAEDRAACLAAGMNDFLSKPVVAEDLVAVVSRWVLPGR